MLKDVSFIQQIQEFLQHIIMGPFLLQNRPDWFYGPISLLFYGVPSWGQSSWEVWLTTHLHLGTKLRMSGATPLLSL